MLYADTSALAKLVLLEPESDVLRIYIRRHGPLASSALAETELIRTTRRRRPQLVEQARGVIAMTTIIDLDRAVLATAASVEPAALRTLDAIHLATALLLGDAFDGVLTYDHRMADAARAAGLRVEAPR